MKTILLLCAIGLTSIANAQELNWYTAEGNDYYVVSNASPGSSASFYSSVHGGKQLSSKTLPESGYLTIIGTREFRPQMVLNNGTRGNNHVAFLGERTFLLENINLKCDAQSITLRWEGAAANAINTEFQVLRSVDGEHYDVVFIQSATFPNHTNAFVYSAPFDGQMAYYKIAVLDKKTSISYTTASMRISASSDISVFPTYTTGKIVIKIPSLSERDEYRIVNSEGKVVASGAPTSIQTNLFLDQLARGNYVIEVANGSNKKQTRIVLY